MDSFVLIIFGITSNLSQIKLIPALYDMEEKGIIPKDMSIVGIARSPMSKDEFKNYLSKILHTENRHHKHEIKQEIFQKLSNRFSYLNGNLDDHNFYKKLNNYLDSLTKQGNDCRNKIYYLATYPDLYEHVFNNLEALGMNKQQNGWVRLMIEKPIGNDEQSAKKLNTLLLKYFTEDQIFRLDHYLGKETLQNILTFRFGNEVFEHLINKDHVDQIQITAAEDFGIGKRGGYYDSVGALKDVGQNHLLQMLAFATMESPDNFNSTEIANKRTEILKHLVPMPDKLVLGQYEGYLNEENVKKNSTTDTFFAFKTEINNERFKGVPIYIRGGKKLYQTVTEISIVFKDKPRKLFNEIPGWDEPNVLIYRIQPNEGIVLKILTKKPGSKNAPEPTYMQFCYRQDMPHYLPDAYERLISDAIKGDQTFFNDATEVETEWKFIDPLAKNNKKPIIYKPGSWGPKESDELLEKDGRKWLEPSMQFCNF